MLQSAAFWNPIGPFRHLKHTSEMIRLPRIGHVNHAACTISIRGQRKAITDRCQVGGGVIEPSITLANNHRQGLAILPVHALKEDTLGTVIGDQQTSLLQTTENRRQIRVVKRFAPFAQTNIKPVVNLLKLSPRLIAEQSPRLQ